MAAPMASHRGKPVGTQAELIRRLEPKLASAGYKIVPIENNADEEASPRPSNGSQLSFDPKRRLFPVKYVQKPPGVPGKGPPKGYDPASVFGLTRDEHMAIRDITELVLRTTPGINMRATVQNQEQKSLIGVVKDRLAILCPEFNAYKGDGHWPFDCYIYLALKASVEKHNRDDKKAKLQSQNDGDDPDRARKHQQAVDRGKAGVRARVAQAQARAQAQAQDADVLAQAGMDLEAETQTGAHEGGHNPDNALEAIAADLSLICMGIDDTDTAENDLGDRVLPTDLVGSEAAPLEALPPASDILPTPASIDTGLGAIQDQLACLKALSPAARAQLSPGVQLLLNILDSGAPLPDLALLSGLLGSCPDTTGTVPTAAPTLTFASISDCGSPALVATPTSALECPVPSNTHPPLPTATSAPTSAPASQSMNKPRPKMRPPPPPKKPLTEPDSACTPSPLVPSVSDSLDSTPVPGPTSVTTIESGTKLRPRLSSKPLTIDKLEPGPTTLNIDPNSNSDSEPLSDLSSASESKQNKGKAEVKGSKLIRGRGGAREKGAAAGAGKYIDTTPKAGHGGKARGNGRGRGRGRDHGQLNLGNNLGPAAPPATNTSRTTRSNRGI